MIRIFCSLFLAFVSVFAVAQVDEVGSGRALRFDGVNDYINLGNIFDDLQLPLTISAWINIGSEDRFSPIMTTQDGDDIYNGFQFVVSPTTLSIEYGDGFGHNSGLYLRAKRATNLPSLANRWVHVCGIMRSPTNMSLYINGYDIGGVYVGSSPNPMNSNFPSDEAKIGYWFSNTNVYRFKGQLDDVRVWNRALSISEIRDGMCRKLTGNESGLIGYWTFDETGGAVVNDKSANNFDGALQNSPERVYSGAPIGDESQYLYTSSWDGVTMTMDNGNSDLEVSSIAGNPWGVHIYKINSQPSQTTNLTAGITPPYFGVFAGSQDANDQFVVQLGNCDAYRRSDNSVSSWTLVTLPVSVTHRLELISRTELAELNLELGNDVTICDQVSYQISTGLDPSVYNFHWSTGQNTPAITVTVPGTYSVEVSSACQSESDQVAVTFLSTPPAFSLGEDMVICKPETFRITVPLGANYDLEWSDGSQGQTIEITEDGEYWLSIRNSCGESRDTILVRKENLTFDFVPNIISPNGDEFNQYFELNRVDEGTVPFALHVYNRWGKKVFESSNYQNEWDGSGLSSGIYFYVVKDACGNQFKGSVSVIK
jgi:gliding motility-associated-like protein